MARYYTNQYGLTVLGLTDCRVGQWVSRPTAVDQTINSVTASFEADNWRARYSDFSDARFTAVTGFVGNVATGVFSVTAEFSCKDIRVYANQSSTTSVTIALHTLTATSQSTSTYTLINSAASAISTWTVDGTARYKAPASSEFKMYRITISGTASSTQPFVFGGIDAQVTHQMVDLRYQASGVWTGFNAVTQTTSETLSSDDGSLRARLTHTTAVPATELYIVRLILLSSDEAREPKVRGLQISATYVTPQDIRRGNWSRLLKLRHEDIKSIDRIYIGSDSRSAWATETSNALRLISRTTKDDPRMVRSVKAWSLNQNCPDPFIPGVKPTGSAASGLSVGCACTSLIPIDNIEHIIGLDVGFHANDYLYDYENVNGFTARRWKRMPQSVVPDGHRPYCIVDVYRTGYNPATMTPTLKLGDTQDGRPYLYGQFLITEGFWREYIYHPYAQDFYAAFTALRKGFDYYTNSKYRSMADIDDSFYLKFTVVYDPNYTTAPVLSGSTIVADTHYHREFVWGGPDLAYQPTVCTLFNSKYRQVDGRWRIADTLYDDALYGQFLGLDEQILRCGGLGLIADDLQENYRSLPAEMSLHYVLDKLASDMPWGLLYYLKNYDTLNANNSGVQMKVDLDPAHASYVRLRWQNFSSDPSNILTRSNKLGTTSLAFWQMDKYFNFDNLDPEVAITANPADALTSPFVIARVLPLRLTNPLFSEYQSGLTIADADSPKRITTSKIFSLPTLHYFEDGVGESWNSNILLQQNDDTGFYAYEARKTLDNSCELYIDNVRRGQIQDWVSDTLIFSARINDADLQVSKKIYLDGDTLPDLSLGLLTLPNLMADPVDPETLPYHVEIVPGSVKAGHRQLADDLIQIDLSLPPEVYGQVPALATVVDAIRCQRSHLGNRDYYLRGIDAALNSDANAGNFSVFNSSTIFIRDIDYTVVFASSEQDGYIQWENPEGNAPLPGELYEIRFASATLQRLGVEFSSDYAIRDNVVRCFRTEPVTGVGVCSPDHDFLSDPLSISDFTLPSGLVDQNTLEFYVADNNPYVETVIENGRVRGKLEMKDIHENWHPTIRDGFYAINQDYGHYNLRQQTKTFGADTVPLLNTGLYQGNSLLIQPGCQNYILNSWFERSNELYSLTGGVWTLTDYQGTSIYDRYNVSRDEYLEAQATFVGDGTLLCYRTPAGYIAFVLDGNEARIETYYFASSDSDSHRVAPYLSEIVASQDTNTLELRVEGYHIQALLNDEIIFDFDQTVYREGYFGVIGSPSQFDIRLYGVKDWVLDSYGDNPVYPQGERLVFDNRGFTGMARSTAVQAVPYPASSGWLSFAGGLLVEVNDSGADSVSPVEITSEDPELSFINLTGDRLYLEKIQLEGEGPTSYTSGARPATELTLPYALPLQFKFEALTEYGSLVTCGNLSLSWGETLTLTIGLQSLSSTEMIIDGLISIFETEEAIALSWNDTVIGTLPKIWNPDRQVTFHSGIGQYQTDFIKVGETIYTFKNQSIQGNTDTLIIPDFMPGTPITVRDNDILYRRTFYLHDGAYVLFDTVDFNYLGDASVDIGIRSSDLLSVYAFTDDGRQITSYQWREGKLYWTELNDSFYGETIHVRFIPRNTYCLNATDLGYRIQLSNVSGQEISVTYEDNLAESEQVLKEIELNPFRASLNNGFIFLADTMPTANTLEARLTPETVTREALLVIDCRSDNGSFTDNVDLLINGQGLTGPILTTYGRMVLVRDNQRLDQLYSGRYIFRYTLLNFPEQSTALDAITVVDRLSRVGIRCEIPVHGNSDGVLLADTYTSYEELQAYSHDTLDDYTHL